jgi:hypothetical protein
MVKFEWYNRLASKRSTGSHCIEEILGRSVRS